MRLTNIIDGPRYVVVALLPIACCVVNAAHAETVSWKDGKVGSWSDAANWSTGTVPSAGDDVVIEGNGARVTLGQTTPDLASIRLEQTLALTGAETILRAKRIHVLPAIPGLQETQGFQGSPARGLRNARGQTRVHS